MGFVTLPDGGIVWVPLTEEEIEKSRRILSFPYEEKKEEVKDIVDYKQAMMRHAAESSFTAKRLISSHKVLFNSINQVATSGKLDAVDIILPVYNSLHVVKLCIDSVLARTEWPYKLIIVDDASDEKTKEYLHVFAEKYPQHLVLTNKKNRGFAATVNRGLLAGTSPYICLLNSDVIATQGWLTKLVLALKADPRNQIVNPTTNNTALINVNMQPGTSYIDMNRALEAMSGQDYPEIMPTGFCFMFPRELIHKIGVFDESYKNYGEESDFFMRMLTYRLPNGVYPRYRAILADNTYMFHERGTSFSQLGTDAHMGFRKSSSERFNRLWPGYKDWASNYNPAKVLSNLRQNIASPWLNTNYKYNVCWVVYSTSFCGGMKYITDIVNYMIEQGINAKVVRILRDEKSEQQVMGELRTSPIVFNSPKDMLDNFNTRVFSEGIVIAATNELVEMVNSLCLLNQNLKPLLHSQSYDPGISPDEETKKVMEENYAKFPVVTNAWWLNETVKNKYNGKTLGFIRPGVDLELFYPRGRESGDERKTVMFIINPFYPFKGLDRAKKTIQHLWNHAAKRNVEIRIFAYGVDNLPELPVVSCLGGISQTRLAQLLGSEVDIFCDPAHVQSYGMPAIEAMASGVVPVLWDNMGIKEYATNDQTAIILPNDSSPESVASKIFELMMNEKKLKILSDNGIQAAKHQDRKVSIKYFVKTLEDYFNLNVEPKKIVVVTPHLRKHGGPTTILHLANNLKNIGHDVTLASVYSDLNPAIVDLCEVPIMLDVNNLPACDVLITNSDNPCNEQFSSLQQAKHKILLKLSHNARFQQLENDALTLPWDRIITSTAPLVEACKTPQVDAGWTHPSREATRVGWYHYGHDIFAFPPISRNYREIKTGMVIGTLIHAHESKGTKIAIDAMEKLKHKYLNAVHFIGVGEIPDYKSPTWMQYFQGLNRSQLANTMRQVDIWVVASFTEGLGRMALEAMSSSCAVVVSDTGAEFAEDGVNCLVFPKGDADQLFNSIELILNSPDLYRRLSKAGFETACEMADPRPLMMNINRVLKEVCK